MTLETSWLTAKDVRRELSVPIRPLLLTAKRWPFTRDWSNANRWSILGYWLTSSNIEFLTGALPLQLEEKELCRVRVTFEPPLGRGLVLEIRHTYFTGPIGVFMPEERTIPGLNSALFDLRSEAGQCEAVFTVEAWLE
jgi:hypothetical protein